MASQLAPLLFAIAAALPGAAQSPAGGAPQEQPASERQASPLDVGPNLVFGSQPLGVTTTGQVVTIQNASAGAVTVTLVRLAGDDPDSFLLMSPPATPFQLGPGQKLFVGVKFHPLKAGGHEAYLRVETATAPALPQSALLVGVGLGPTGDEVLINCGGGDYSSSGGQVWPADFGFLKGVAIQGGPFAYGTPDPELYRDQRQGTFFAYALPLANGTYSVALHFAELQVPYPGTRVFDVRAEGVTLIDDLDLTGQVGFGKAHVEVRDVTVSDGLLQLEFQASAGEALVSAIEVHGLAQVVAEPAELDFGAVASGATAQLPVVLQNKGALTAELTALSLKLGPAGTPESMTVEAFGQRFAGAPGDSTYGLSATLAPGASAPLLVKFSPSTDQFDECQLVIDGNFVPLTVKLVGLGGHEGHPYLHVVIETDPVLVDYDENGSESAVLDGSLSHTHEPGKSLVGYAWSEGATPLASAPVTVQTLALGKHSVSLTITDDNVPPQSYSGSASVEVVQSSAVPGILATYYDASDGPETPLSLLAVPPPQADFAEIVPGLSVGGFTSIGTSPFAADVMVRFQGKVDLPQAGIYNFVASGGSARVILLEGFVVPGPVSLPPGTYKVDARFAVDASGALPLEVQVGIDGGPLGPVAAAWLEHDESHMPPLITAMPSVGTTLGGNQIHIDGLGFFPGSQVVVHWGSMLLGGGSLQSVAPDEIVLVSPPGSGVIQVQVETPNGSSNPVAFTYDASGPVPINFVQQPSISVHAPTAGVWGPDQRFYVGCQDGRITAFQFDDAYHVVGQTTYAGVSALTNHDLLGVALNPWDPPSPVRLYVAHGKHFVSGGTSFTGPSPYTGQVSVLTGPTFDQPEPLITQLPTSNHDHAVNGLDFDNNGDLLICVGSNTNAGVKHPLSGDLVESPLSAAIVKAETSKPDFDGHIHYLLSASGGESTDQVDGELVDVAPGSDVHVQAPGVRNAYELVYATSGKLYVADNGPNAGFGAASTGPATEGPHPQEADEILLVEYDNYYGHPNRSRGRYDARQNVYRNGTEPSIPGEFVQTMSLQNSSLDGLDEYRAETFQGQMRGDLITQRMGSYAYRVRLADDGRSVLSFDQLGEWSGALAVATLPGGAFVSLAQGLDWMHVYLPNDLSAVGLKVHDVFPWRGPETGGTPFVLGGVGFGTLGNTSVRFDGVPAVLTSVSPTRIRGITPADSHHGGALVTITVKVGTAQSELPGAFRYLYPPGQELGTWENLPNLPTNLGEVAAGIINGVVYVVGSASASTLRYSIAGHAWLSSGATRPFPGDHHAAEVLNGKLYLIGGLEAGSEGKVQIYDPVSNQWSLGTSMPWAAGSVSTAVINGKIHAAGGIVGTTTVANHSVYDPAFGTWTPKAPMPLGRNHTAAGTDGTRFYVFGGRDGGNFVTNGFDDVQIYNPATNSWQWSKDGVSGLKPLPQFRGGMGKSAFYQGEFYVFGGETATGPGAVAGGVYDRVDVYRPATNTWRLEKKMPHPRHGIFPVLYQSRVLLPGGGVMAGSSASNIFDVFTRQ